MGNFINYFCTALLCCSFFVHFYLLANLLFKKKLFDKCSTVFGNFILTEVTFLILDDSRKFEGEHDLGGS